MSIHHDYMYLLFPAPNQQYLGKIVHARMREPRHPDAQPPLFRPRGLQLFVEYRKEGALKSDEITIPEREAVSCLWDFRAWDPCQLIGRPITAHVSIDYLAGISNRTAIEC